MSHQAPLFATRYSAPVATLVAAAALTGCSGQPSASDIDQAVRKNLAESQAQLQKLSGSKNTIGEIHDVKKLGCKPDNGTAWRCDVEIDITQFGNRAKGPASFRFVKGSEGWSLTR